MQHNPVCSQIIIKNVFQLRTCEVIFNYVYHLTFCGNLFPVIAAYKSVLNKICNGTVNIV